MRLNMFVSMILLLLFGICEGYSQDDLNVTEILSGFPKGDYSEITFYDKETLENAKAYKVYRECHDPLNIRYLGQSPIPKEYLESVVYMASARNARFEILVAAKRENDTAARNAGRENYRQRWATEKRDYFLSSKGEKIFIYGVDDVKVFIDFLQKEGIIKKTDYTVEGNAVYTLSGNIDARKANKGNGTCVCPCGEDQLIVCESLEMLEQMLKAKSRQVESLLDNDEYSEVILNVGEYGQEWYYYDHVIGKKKILISMQKQGEKKEELDKVEKSIRNNINAELISIRVADRMAIQYGSVYYSKDKASEAYNKSKSKYSGQDGVEIKIDGQKVCTTEVYTDEKVEMYKEKMKRQMERYEKMKKEEESKNKEG